MEGSAFNLLLDMDALFDTRMGTLIDINPEVSKHLDLMVYRNRQLDDFEKLTNGAITNEVFKERYSRRDQTILQNSMTTGIVPILMNYIDSLKERFFRGVDVSEIRVDINMHPYFLPGPTTEMIKGCLESLLPPYANVGVVSLSPSEMSPGQMEYLYNGWITYDFHTWLEAHHEQLLVTPLNGLTVILPRIFVEDPGERVVKEEEGDFKPEDRHGHFEMIMEEYVHLEHIPVSDYCFLLPGTYRLPDDGQAQFSSSSS